MNKIEKDILLYLNNCQYINQRVLAGDTDYSLGSVNKALSQLIDMAYIDEDYSVLNKAKDYLNKLKPRNAIILAAGYGLRMIPINNELPKGLIEIEKEPLIERLIKQLKEVSINEIYIVVGFMKEQYEYLIDKYGVELIVNKEYINKNNISSMYRAIDKLKNTYIVPCDVWCRNNPFRSYEAYSWYMVSDKPDEESTVKINRKGELLSVKKNETGNKMVGIAYLCGDESGEIKNKIIKFQNDKEYNDKFWEEALIEPQKYSIYGHKIDDNDVYEINTFEQLREIEGDSDQLETDAISVIMKVLNVKLPQIKNISVLKKGMTNRSFLFDCQYKKYIMRVPGAGTDMLINRSNEYNVYQTISGCEISDKIIYINPENGYKIAELIDNARNCDAYCEKDLELCMRKLKQFHNKKFVVDHDFDIFERIQFYENLRGNASSAYRDYSETKRNVLSLKSYIDEYAEDKALTHIDAVADNFLIVNNDVSEEVRLIDWEYAGMQDPHVDIAMFCVYSMYDREYVDKLIDIYFENNCSHETRVKIYCYIAACGLLWSNWCEYKLQCGVEFGEYNLKQYRFAKDYYRIAIKEIEEMRRCIITK